MKKILFALLMAACLVLPALAQESSASTPVWNHGDNVANVTYRTVQIYRVYDQNDAYIVLYEKQDAQIGQVVIPKSWTDGEAQTERRLFFRNKIKNLGSYMTVYYKNGDFWKVILTVPFNHRDAVWSAAPYGTQVNTDIDTLDIDY